MTMSTSRRSERKLIEHADLLRHIAYDPNTGIFTWKISQQGRIRGRPAGALATDGYRVIHILGKRYPAHHLAWFYVYAEWPPDTIDHINGHRSDNAIRNLRLATLVQNSQNRRASKTSRSGVRGVRFKKNRWEVSIQVNGIRKYVGRFQTLNEAVAAHAAYAKPLVGDFYNI